MYEEVYYQTDMYTKFYTEKDESIVKISVLKKFFTAIVREISRGQRIHSCIMLT